MPILASPLATIPWQFAGALKPFRSLRTRTEKTGADQCSSSTRCSLSRGSALEISRPTGQTFIARLGDRQPKQVPLFSLPSASCLFRSRCRAARILQRSRSGPNCIYGLICYGSKMLIVGQRFVGPPDCSRSLNVVTAGSAGSGATQARTGTPRTDQRNREDRKANWPRHGHSA